MHSCRCALINSSEFSESSTRHSTCLYKDQNVHMWHTYAHKHYLLDTQNTHDITNIYIYHTLHIDITHGYIHNTRHTERHTHHIQNMHMTYDTIHTHITHQTHMHDTHTRISQRYKDTHIKYILYQLYHIHIQIYGMCNIQSYIYIYMHHATYQTSNMPYMYIFTNSFR